MTPAVTSAAAYAELRPNLGGRETRPISFRISARGCFEITSHHSNAEGYAEIVISGETIKIHRHIYRECFGEIPVGYFICHKCDNPSCINPEHLFLGTVADNNMDHALKGRTPTKLTKDIVTSIRERYLPHDPRNGCRAMAREYKVDPHTMHGIVRRKTWRWV